MLGRAHPAHPKVVSNGPGEGGFEMGLPRHTRFGPAAPYWSRASVAWLEV